MKLRDLLIATGILAVLLGVLYWSNHRKSSEDTTVKASPDAPTKILSLNQADIVRFSIHRKDQLPVELSRTDSGAWQITAPKSLTADQEAVSSLLSTISPLNSSRLLEEKTSDPASYGLSQPALELEISPKGNKTQKLLIGDETPSGNAYYAMLSGDPRLFTLASYNKSSLDKTVSDLRDKRLLTADFDKVSQIELIGQQPGKKQDITFARNKDAWQILKPKPWRADSDHVADLIRRLRDAKLESASETADAEAVKAYRSASPCVTVKITGTSGTQELALRKAKDDYYAKSSVLAGSYKVPASLATSLDKSLDDFRNKKLFDFGYAEPNKIEIHDGPKSYFLTRSTSDWWGPDGKKLDESSVQALVSKLRDLSAEKFPDSGFTAPVLDLTVVSNDNKRTEKVLVSKSGETYIAKRENEPSLYEISTATMTELEKSAADVKPAAVPPTPQKK